MKFETCHIGHAVKLVKPGLSLSLNIRFET
jgi:hypothetical protein